MAPDPLALLKDGTAEIVPEGGLEEKLALGRPLRVKLGLDPTAADVTLGWAVVLRKLRQFQDAGHTAVLIVGDFTARVGDPSGKSETRPASRQGGRAGVRRAPARTVPPDPVGRASRGPLQLRMARGHGHGGRPPPHVLVHGGADARSATTSRTGTPRGARSRSWSSCTRCCRATTPWRSRPTSSSAGPTSCSTCWWAASCSARGARSRRSPSPTPLLEGLDGVQKMSQSLGNYVGVTEPADEMFGKLMRIPDELIGKYLRLVAWMPSDEAARVEAGWRTGSSKPNDQKRAMARAVVELYHGAGAGERAEEAFNRVHRDRELPEVVPEVRIPDGAVEDGAVWLPRLLVALDLADIQRRRPPADRAGRGQAGRRARHGSGVRGSPRGPGGQGPAGGKALVRPSGLGPVDGLERTLLPYLSGAPHPEVPLLASSAGITRLLAP